MIIAAINPTSSLCSRSRAPRARSDRAANRDLHPGLYTRVAGVEHALRDLLGELVAADVEQDRDEGGLLVLADLRRALLGEGIDHGRDVREDFQPLVGGLDRLVLVRVRDLAGLRVEDQWVAAVLLRWESDGEEVGRRLAVGPGQPQVVARVAAEAVGERDDGGQSDDPCAQHHPLPSCAELAEPVQTPGHAVEASTRSEPRLGSPAE
jgi:hypothetical protein